MSFSGPIPSPNNLGLGGLNNGLLTPNLSNISFGSLTPNSQSQGGQGNANVSSNGMTNIYSALPSPTILNTNNLNGLGPLGLGLPSTPGPGPNNHPPVPSPSPGGHHDHISLSNMNTGNPNNSNNDFELLEIPAIGNNLRGTARKGIKKKKNIKNSSAAGAPRAQGQASQSDKKSTGGVRKKKSQNEEIIFVPSEINSPLPINLKAFALHYGTNKYHECKILERKSWKPHFYYLNSHFIVNPNSTNSNNNNNNAGANPIINDSKLISQSPAPCSNITAIPNDPSSTEKDRQATYGNHSFYYYIHYPEWDRRMDEWVTRDRIRLKSEMIITVNAPKKEKIHPDQSNNNNTSNDRNLKGGAGAEKEKEEMEVEADHNNNNHGNNNDGHQDDQGHGKDEHDPEHALSGHGNFSAEDIHAHEEATKVKNIEAIQFGKYRMSTWYYSPIPTQYNEYKILHFCEYCLAFFGFEEELIRHSRRCTLRHPPGNEFYRSDERNVSVAVFEVDGAIERVYCQNLCYIAKFFLDHKTLEYDCTPFLFYIFCEIDKDGYHIVGYFSKEKVSQNRYNLACILTLPCHQRKGYGRLIISLSYELSKIEEKPGSPEKPISDLGMVSYMSYWSNTLIKLLKSQQANSKEVLSIEDISRRTCILCDDIVECLKALNILVWYKGKWVYSETNLEIANENLIKKEESVNNSLLADPSIMYVAACRPEKLHWTPYFINKKQRGAP